jgi:hypothetical protein
VPLDLEQPSPAPGSGSAPERAWQPLDVGQLTEQVYNRIVNRLAGELERKGL